MIVPLLALLLQVTSGPTPAPRDVSGQGDKPVHVWLDASSPLARGSAVRVYVQVVADGNLVVLHRRTDGRIGVLFPGNPTGAPFVRAGTYEIRAASDRPAFVVAEPDGQGMILAALATDPLRFDEFVRAADWNPDALVPSWGGADAEGALSDIVQRMLGDGTFNYDFVTYTVAPAVYAQQDSTPAYAPYPTCVGCTFIGAEFVVAAPFLGCDDFFGVCLGFPHFHHRFEHRQPATAPSRSVLALNLRPQASPVAMPRSRQPLIPKGNHSNPVIEPRPRVPTARPSAPAAMLPARGEPAILEHPVALHPAGATIATRRRVAGSTPLAAARPTITAPLSHVRYTRLSQPNPNEDMSRGSVVAVSRGAVVVAGGASVSVAARSRTAVWASGATGATGAAPAAPAAAATTPRTNVAAATSAAAPAIAPRARSTARVGPMAAGTHAVALPRAAWHAGGRAVVARGPR